jgi:hypothetical protein
MRMRTAMIAGVGMVIGALATMGVPTLTAQQTIKAPAVISPHGFIVEEVRVGQSCVVIVFRGGAPSGDMVAVPCSTE